MTDNNAFKRSNKILSIISYLAANFSGIELQMKMAQVPTYYSRGKGKGLHQAANRHKTMSIVRASKKKHNINKRKAK